MIAVVAGDSDLGSRSPDGDSSEEGRLGYIAPRDDCVEFNLCRSSGSRSCLRPWRDIRAEGVAVTLSVLERRIVREEAVHCEGCYFRCVHASM